MTRRQDNPYRAGRSIWQLSLADLIRQRQPLIIGYIVKGRSDLANHLREFVVPLLRVLRQDATPDTPVELSLRLMDRFHSNPEV